MLEGLNTAAAGMAAQQRRLDAVANDLANASTTGYKHVRLGFRDLVYQAPGRPGAEGVTAGSGSAAVDAGRNYTQGALRTTDSPLDVALQGEGFLQVRLPDGRTALTRDGALHLDADRRLVTASGAVLQPAITIPADVTASSLGIASDGTVSAGDRTLGRLNIVGVRAPQGLVAVGDNAFVTSPASGPAVTAPAGTRLSQGALEASNVDVGDAMVDLIDAQRSYQLASRAIQTADEMAGIANGVKR